MLVLNKTYSFVAENEKLDSKQGLITFNPKPQYILELQLSKLSHIYFILNINEIFSDLFSKIKSM